MSRYPRCQHENPGDAKFCLECGDWLVVKSGSVSYGQATPYLPVIDLLEAYCEIDARDDGQRIREKVTGKLLTLDETLRPVLPALLASLDVSVEDRDWHALDLSQRRPQPQKGIKGDLRYERFGTPVIPSESSGALITDVLSRLGRFDEAVGHAGQIDEAARHAREALALAEPLGMRPLVAHCHLGLGKLCHRTGKRGPAREHLRTATAMYRDMEMRV